MPKEIVVEISEDGKEITIEAFGYKGHGCVEDAVAFAKVIGKLSKVTRKPEYYRVAHTIRTRKRVRLRGEL